MVEHGKCVRSTSFYTLHLEHRTVAPFIRYFSLHDSLRDIGLTSAGEREREKVHKRTEPKSLCVKQECHCDCQYSQQEPDSSTETGIAPEEERGYKKKPERYPELHFPVFRL